MHNNIIDNKHPVLVANIFYSTVLHHGHYINLLSDCLFRQKDGKIDVTNVLKQVLFFRASCKKKLTVVCLLFDSKRKQGFGILYFMLNRVCKRGFTWTRWCMDQDIPVPMYLAVTVQGSNLNLITGHHSSIVFISGLTLILESAGGIR